MEGFQLQAPTGRELVGGDILAQCLAYLGVTTAFGLHGGHLDSFLVSCEDMAIKLVDVRHESVAVQAAEGYAKISGKVGVAFVTANSGFCNALPGLATAFADRSRVLCITASAPTREMDTNHIQAYLDQTALARPITKFATRIRDVEEIPRIVSHAWKLVNSGTPGPVVLDFTAESLFFPPRSLDSVVWGSLSCATATPPAPSPKALQEVLQLWRSAKRPAIVVGTGAARTSDPDSATGISPLLKLAETMNTPVFYSTKFAPNLPAGHRLRVGNAGFLAVMPYVGIEKPDLIILLGARSGWPLGARSGAMLPKDRKDTKIIQIDIDGGEIGRDLPVHLGVVADSREFISTVLDLYQKSGDNSTATNEVSDAAWVASLASLKTLGPQRFSADAVQQEDGRVHPFHAISTAFAGLAEERPIVIMDGSECCIWATEALESLKPTYALASGGYLAMLGTGWGLSLGAGVACRGDESGLAHLKDRLVINLQGDGSAGFHLQELDTFARHGLTNILTIVVNNSVWGMSISGQDIVYNSDPSNATNPRRPCSTLSPSCEFDTVARGLGCVSAKCTDIAQIPDAINGLRRQMRERNTSGLLELVVSRFPIPDVTRMLVGKPENYDKGGSDVILIPYYDNIARPTYKKAA